MAPSRPLVRSLAALGLVALLAGCADDGETTTTEASSTTEATSTPAGTGVEAEACAGLAGWFPRPVTATEPPEDDSAAVAAIELLATEGPEPVRSSARAVLDLQALEDDGAPWEDAEEGEVQAAYTEGLAGAEDLYRWALGSCPTSEVVWSCLETSGRTTFATVGEAIAGPDGETDGVTTTTASGAATPEEVVAEGVSEGDPVEISRSDAEVVVAWLDAEGHAVEALTVVDDDGWRSDGSVLCEDLATADEDFEPIGEAVEPPG
jgi:hypothetical protein